MTKEEYERRIAAVERSRRQLDIWLARDAYRPDLSAYVAPVREPQPVYDYVTGKRVHDYTRCPEALLRDFDGDSASYRADLALFETLTKG